MMSDPRGAADARAARLAAEHSPRGRELGPRAARVGAGGPCRILPPLTMHILVHAPAATLQRTGLLLQPLRAPPHFRPPPPPTTLTYPDSTTAAAHGIPRRERSDGRFGTCNAGVWCVGRTRPVVEQDRQDCVCACGGDL